MNRFIASVAFAALTLAARSAWAIDLEQAFAAALAYDAEFAADASAAEAGRELAVQGRAQYLPKLSLSGQYNRLDTKTELDLPPEIAGLLESDASGKVYGYSLQLSQPLYRADLRADAKSLSKQAEISELSYRAARQNLILRVAQAYFEVLLAEDALEFAVAQKAAVAEQLAGAEARFESGRARVTDVAEARASYDALVAQEIAARSDLEVSRARFVALTGREGEDPDPIGATGAAAAAESLETWLARAREDSIELRIRGLEVAIAESQVRKAGLAGRPQLDLVAKYEDSRQDGELSQLAYPERSEGKSVGVQFSMPLFAGGALQSRYRQAVAEHNQARQTLEATQREVAVDTRAAWSSVTAGALRVAALEQGLVSAQTSLEAGELGLEVGTRTSLDVLNLRQQVFDAKRDLADARYTWLLARLQLAAIAGRLSEGALGEIT